MSLLLKLKDRLFYGWVIVFSFLIIGTALWGTRLSFGVFLKSLESEFDLTRAGTSVIFSVYMALGIIFAVIGGRALDRYGPKVIVLLMGISTGLSLLLTSQVNSLWQLFITYSLLLSIGTGPLYVVLMSTVSRWFDKKRGLAVGIASSGIGLGTIFIAPFATYLITILDWRMTYLIMGILVCIAVIPLSGFLRKDPHEVGALPDGAESTQPVVNKEEYSVQSTGLSLLQVIRTRSFWLIIFIWMLFASPTFVIFTHLVAHTTDIGFSPGQAATVFSIIGASGIAGRVLMGIIADRIGRKRTAILCVLLQAGTFIWLAFSQDLWMLYVFAIIYGFANGGMTTSMSALIGDTFGLARMGTILGLLDVGFGIGAAVGSTIGGLIFDITNNYFIAFLAGAAVLFIVTVLMALIRQETNENSGAG